MGGLAGSPEGLSVYLAFLKANPSRGAMVSGYEGARFAGVEASSDSNVPRFMKVIPVVAMYR